MGPAVEVAVAEAHRREWGFVLAATVRVTRDIDTAEECVQDAYARALSSWRQSGVPAKPGAWLTTVARRRAIDLMRRRATEQRAMPSLARKALAGKALTVEPVETEGDGVPDDRLRLIFICCHPALSTEAQVALTLRLLCGVTTNEVARAFLVSEATMAARITRAKKKIASAGIPFRVPPASELAERTDAALTVVHLLFTTGHAAPAGPDLVRRDLVERALDLARMLRALLPQDGDVAGLLALLLLTDARRPARTSGEGQLVLLADQDRSTWDRAQIAEGTDLLRQALTGRPPSRFALMAAIAAVHTESATWEATDWDEIVGLYDVLINVWPSPVVALNRAAAIGFARGPEAGLAALDALATEPQLASYSYAASARADMLRRLGRFNEARLSYEEALMLSENDVERQFLTRRLHELA